MVKFPVTSTSCAGIVAGRPCQPEKLEGYVPETLEKPDLTESIAKTVRLLQQAKKPVILAGNGIKLADATEDFYKLLEVLPIPVLTTWKTIDMLGEEDELYVGHPGGMGDRGANLILQSADVLLSIGSRLDTSLTAFNEPHFGMSAKKIVVDIDQHELDRMKLEQVEAMQACDAGDYIRSLYHAVVADEKIREQSAEWKTWNAYGHELRAKYPSVTTEHREKQGVVSAYYFTELLCKHTTKEDVIVPESSGAAGEITYQAFSPKRGQKMKNAAGLGSMGYGFPAAIGAKVGEPDKEVCLFTGDGSFQMNIQELSTCLEFGIPLKIFILDNHTLGMVRQWQKMFYHGHISSTNLNSNPDFIALAKAYGHEGIRIEDPKDLETGVKKALAMKDKLVIVDIVCNTDAKVLPMQQMGGSMSDMFLNED